MHTLGEVDTVLTVSSAGCGEPLLYCNDDCTGLGSAIELPMRAAQTVFLVIEGYGGTDVDFVLSIEEFSKIECSDGLGTTGGPGGAT